eukprot:Opistho-2@94260
MRILAADDAGKGDDVSIDPVFEDYLTALFEFYYRGLPGIYALKPTKPDWMSAAACRAFDTKFLVPNPHLLKSIPQLQKHYMSAPSIALHGAVVHLIDYELFYHDIMPTRGLKCICGALLHRNGYADGFRAERTFLGSTPCFFKYVTYKCPGNCSLAKGPSLQPGSSQPSQPTSTHYTALDPLIVEQLPPIVCELVPFVVTSRSIIPVATVESVLP